MLTEEYALAGWRLPAPCTAVVDEVLGRWVEGVNPPALFDATPLGDTCRNFFWYILSVRSCINLLLRFQNQKATRLALLGAKDNRFDSWGARLKETATVWFAQTKVLEDRVAGAMHVLMFWGFLMLSTDVRPC